MSASASTILPPLPAAARGTRRRLVVAMSGGVDSSVVAALLKEQGHDVIGVTLQLYDSGAARARKGACCAGQDIHDARRVAAHLDIPHYVLDYERRFEEAVIQGFADAYARGETPIPCVTCNQQIKFTDLLETARDLGAETLATGHYVRLEHGAEGPIVRRAADADRDQSYFLFNTTRQQFARLAFPLGALPKAEVRALARRLGLPVADKPDSQDICFVPEGRYAQVVEKLRPDAVNTGNIVHLDGRVLGRHAGIINYTIGQRRGLGIPGREPLYVMALDAGRAEVVVGPREALHTDTITLRNVNWLGDGTPADWPSEGIRIGVRVRSSQRPQPAVVSCTDTGDVAVVLEAGERGVAAGQACVFYEDLSADARVLGGGWISRALRRAVHRVGDGEAVAGAQRDLKRSVGAGD